MTSTKKNLIQSPWMGIIIAILVLPMGIGCGKKHSKLEPAHKIWSEFERCSKFGISETNTFELKCKTCDKIHGWSVTYLEYREMPLKGDWGRKARLLCHNREDARTCSYYIASTDHWDNSVLDKK